MSRTISSTGISSTLRSAFSRVEVAGERGIREIVDLLVQEQHLQRRQVGPEQALLPHHQGDLPQEGGVTPEGGVSQHADLPAAGVEQAGEHLERRRLLRADWPEKANNLARLAGERDPVDGVSLESLSPEQALQ
jgi:hypothetical protein